MRTIVVITLYEGLLHEVLTFHDSPEGREKAERTFRKEASRMCHRVVDQAVLDLIDAGLKAGSFRGDDGAVYIRETELVG